MKLIHAVYEGGVFRPVNAVDLPERCEVEFVPKIVDGNPPPPGNMESIYELMSQRFETGQTDLSARHDEHQP
jgi:predicted DNA-binding antitoxin AbrB/MazE fold protein